jgi:hypothetical protein
MVFEIDKNDKEKIKKYFYIHQSSIKKILLFIPSLIGYIFHFPLYYLIHLSIRNKAQDHYDSIMTGLLFFMYLFYVLMLTLIIFFSTKNPLSFGLLLLIPLTALCLLHFKSQIK